MKKNKKKIAILGSSLPMLLLAEYLKQKIKAEITIYENYEKLGGAWTLFRYKKNF